GEPITWQRMALGALVLIGVSMAVTGQTDAGAALPPLFSQAWIVGIVGGLLSALAYSGSTLLARWAVPRYGALRVLFMQLIGGTVILGVMLPLMGHTPAPPTTVNGWILVVGLGLGSVFAANMFFFAGVRRIEAAPTAIAASVEPVVGALLAFLVLSQGLTLVGWLGLLLVVLGVVGGYLETREDRSGPGTGDSIPPTVAAARSS
ncbi:MAG TPA: DMT family transporter, partial [Longimicrobiales bacterium]|nr:DMT family transporter [Longimicrobiales bacterium]